MSNTYKKLFGRRWSFLFIKSTNMKEKTKEQRLKNLYKQLNRVQNQPTTRESREFGYPILTQRGRLEARIKTLENTK